MNPVLPSPRVAVVGASGYAGEDLVRLLLGHPNVRLTALTSRQYAGQTVAGLFPRFSHFPGAASLKFTQPDAAALGQAADIVFLALPHGVAAEFALPLYRQGVKVIDLSADFRLRSPELYKEFYGQEHPAPELLRHAVYGLPEINRQVIREAALVSCPGCYPTSILVPLIPLLRGGLIDPAFLIANSLSGVTGAGRKLEAAYLFAECNESLRPYGVPKHRHLSEIEQELSIAANAPVLVQFTPHLVPVNRGILTTLCLAPHPEQPWEGAEEAVKQVDACYNDAYGQEPFIRLLPPTALPDTKNVTGTNFIEIAWRVDPRTRRLIVMSAVDNIVKGTAGQAIQCMNLMAGIAETTGLL